MKRNKSKPTEIKVNQHALERKVEAFFKSAHGQRPDFCLIAPDAGTPISIAQLLRKKALAEKFHVSVRTLENWRRDGLLPAAIKISNVVLYDWQEVVDHLKANFKVD